tara:strand:+ start:418 stop:1098 length:681 start_codon:yes stop_codon:yes gene_type:complete
MNIKKKQIRFDFLSIFPNSLDNYFNSSIIKRAQEKKIVVINKYNIRDNTNDKHKTVDDVPYGGGPGMILKIEPIYKTLKKIYPKKNKSTRIILLTPRGKTFNQNKVKKLSKYKRLILIAGHYEAIDARIDKFIDEKISIGNFILTGGELGAGIIIDSVSRIIPGVIGKLESLKEESFSEYNKKTKKFNIEYPQYTRPGVFKNLKVPKVLLSGHHQKIKKWRENHSK